jgi:hypothetical protein
MGSPCQAPHRSLPTAKPSRNTTTPPGLKAWLGDLGDGKRDGGPEDPRVGVVGVKTETAIYALVRKNVAARAMDMAQGAVTGSAPQVE